MRLMMTFPRKTVWKAEMMIRTTGGLSIQHKACEEHDDDEVGEEDDLR
jgi:hypothetical protein